MFLARKHTNLSSTEVGRLMGKDHTTVLLAQTRITAKLKDNSPAVWNTPEGIMNKPIRAIVEQLEGQLGNGAASHACA